MLLDDHEVMDDWGISFTAATQTERVRGAIRRYHAFQQAHNPPGRANQGFETTPVDYSFQRGPVAFCMIDGRTQRDVANVGSPVLGSNQITRFQQWARNDAVNADVTIVVVGTPFAFAKIRLLKEAITAIDQGGAAVAGGIVGTAVLGSFGGPVGGILGWGIGSAVGGWLGGEAVNEYETVDVADQWAEDTNKPDLAVVLDELFDLSNDVHGNEAHPRAVIVLAGDAHVGAVHPIYSSVPRHQRNPVIWQFTSSPISHLPATPLKKYLDSNWLTPLVPSAFQLCESTLGGTYSASRKCPFMAELNFGTLTIARRVANRRLYEVRAAIRGETHEYRQDLQYDLDAGTAPTTPWNFPLVFVSPLPPQ